MLAVVVELEMKVKVLAGIFILFFFALICVTLFGDRHMRGLTSDELSTRKTEIQNYNEKGKAVRTDYVDENGTITQASDKGYAIVIKTYVGKKVILEEYFDESGSPVALPAGYFAVSRSYNDLGQNVLITYLDADGEPVVISSGYDSIHRTFNADGKADIDTYYIGDEQVMRKGGYYGYQRLYTDGRATTLRYLDRSGKLMMRDGGYAEIRREFDEDGKVVRRMYYDASGKPVTIGRFQYGIELVDGRSVYLDENGERMLRLDNFLFTHPVVVLCAGVALTVIAVLIAVRGGDKLRLAFLICYLMFIGFMTLLYRESGDPRGRMELFWSYRRFLSSASIRRGILNNIWLFVPFGAALYKKPERYSENQSGPMMLWQSLLIPAALSCLIEAVQYFGGIGMCEVDDVISNSLGGWIGYGFAAACDRLF